MCFHGFTFSIIHSLALRHNWAFHASVSSQIFCDVMQILSTLPCFDGAHFSLCCFGHLLTVELSAARDYYCLMLFLTEQCVSVALNPRVYFSFMHTLWYTYRVCETYLALSTVHIMYACSPNFFNHASLICTAHRCFFFHCRN